MDCVVNGGNVKGSKTYPPFTCPEKRTTVKNLCFVCVPFSAGQSDLFAVQDRRRSLCWASGRWGEFIWCCPQCTWTHTSSLNAHRRCVSGLVAHSASIINITYFSLSLSRSICHTARAAVCQLLPLGICLLPVCTTFLQQVRTVFVYKLQLSVPLRTQLCFLLSQKNV